MTVIPIKKLLTLMLCTLFVMSMPVVGVPDTPDTEAPITDTNDETQDTQPPIEDVVPSPEKPATLDELLGLEEAGEEAPEDAAQAEQEDDLDRVLEESSMQDNFSVAIEKMEISANMLGTRHQSGLGTQRIQEDILRRLEYLMDQAKQQQSMQSQSSQSSSQSQPSPQDLSDPQANEQQQQGQSQQTQNQNQGQAENTPPSRQEGDINTNLDEERREWGTLPERIREQLLQGRNEAFSRLYEKMTRSYYRLLAEEDSP